MPNGIVFSNAIPSLQGSQLQTPSVETSSSAIHTSSNTTVVNTNQMSTDYSRVDSVSNIFTQGNLPHKVPQSFSNKEESALLASNGYGTTAITEATAGDAPKAAACGSPPEISPAESVKLKQMPPLALGKGQCASTAIYTDVKEPYPYASSFHKMLSMINNQLPTHKVVRIAKSLGEIRPSLMACTINLTGEDLVISEMCFQRTLFVFKNFLLGCSAPTIVCRRSGEVAAVNNAFVTLTGWTEAVLLGREPNRNVSPVNPTFVEAAQRAPAST